MAPLVTSQSDNLPAGAVAPFLYLGMEQAVITRGALAAVMSTGIGPGA